MFYLLDIKRFDLSSTIINLWPFNIDLESRQWSWMIYCNREIGSFGPLLGRTCGSIDNQSSLLRVISSSTEQSKSSVHPGKRIKPLWRLKVCNVASVGAASNLFRLLAISSIVERNCIQAPSSIQSWCKIMHRLSVWRTALGNNERRHTASSLQLVCLSLLSSCF